MYPSAKPPAAGNGLISRLGMTASNGSSGLEGVSSARGVESAGAGSTGVVDSAGEEFAGMLESAGAAFAIMGDVAFNSAGGSDSSREMVGVDCVDGSEKSNISVDISVDGLGAASSSERSAGVPAELCKGSGSSTKSADSEDAAEGTLTASTEVISPFSSESSKEINSPSEWMVSCGGPDVKTYLPL